MLQQPIQTEKEKKEKKEKRWIKVWDWNVFILLTNVGIVDIK